MKTDEEQLRKQAIETIIEKTEFRIKKLYEQEKYTKDYILNYQKDLEKIRVNIITEKAKLDALKDI